MPHSSYEFTAKECIIPLVGAEIPQAVLNMPLAFVKQEEEFLLVAVLSLTPGTNLFVGLGGRWVGKYVPSVFRGYPFRLAKGGKNRELLLCVDEDSGLINGDRTAGEPFFDDSGQLSPQVNEVLGFLTRVEKSRRMTATAVSALAEADLLVEWPLKIKDGDRGRPVTGLFQLDGPRLNRLDDAQFLAVRKAGALPIAYGQLLSMNNMVLLGKMAKMPAEAIDKDPDITAMLGDDDMLSFQ